VQVNIVVWIPIFGFILVSFARLALTSRQTFIKQLHVHSAHEARNRPIMHQATVMIVRQDTIKMPLGLLIVYSVQLVLTRQPHKVLRV
jgi:hypothetical protein